VHLVSVLIPVAILLGTAFETPGTRLSLIVPRAELLLGAIAVLILEMWPHSVSYVVAVWIVYVLCLARYLRPFPARHSLRMQ
jgi:hypothetical protein